jgi:hypothetical protein
VRGSKGYSYTNPKTIPGGQHHDKLVNPRRIGDFVGYTTKTKQLRGYSSELGYTFRSSKVLIDEKVTRGSIDLQHKNGAHPWHLFVTRPKRYTLVFQLLKFVLLDTIHTITKFSKASSATQPCQEHQKPK